MSSNRKSRRSAGTRRLRRSGLAALMITCGVLGSVTADEGDQKSSLNLRLLPPLPVGIGQLTQVSNSAPVPATNSSQVRVNPYAKPALVRQSSTQPAESTAVLRQVGGFIPLNSVAVNPADGGKANAAAARLVSPSESTFSLKKAAGPDAETGPLAASSTARQNPWVVTGQASPLDVSPSSAPPETTAQSGSMETTEPSGQHARFSLSDDNAFENESALEDGNAASEVEGFRLRDDGGAVVLDAVPLLKVAPPTMLRAAEPVQLSEVPSESKDIDSAESLVRDGDVRSATGKVEVRRRVINNHVAAAPMVDIDLQSADTGSESFEEAFIPSEPDEANGFTRIPSSQLPVPQIYRPQQSLVIDVPAAKPSIEQVSAENSDKPIASKSDPIFEQKIADVISVRVAQSQAFTPSEPVRRVQLENRDICEAVLVGNHKLLLIGRSQGATRLAIWCGEETKPQLYEIQVESGNIATPGSSLEAIATRLTETIAATYPSCRVRVVPHGEGLAVIGNASDAKSAREIMRLVRSACLKSVSDRLEVR